MVLFKCCTQYVSKFGKLSCGHRTEKVNFTPIAKRAMPKNILATVELYSFHMLTRLFSKSFKLGFSSSGTKNFQMYKLGFEETENQRSDCQYSLHHGESKGVSEKYLLLLHELHENL